jgi:hypothetical protein
VDKPLDSINIWAVDSAANAFITPHKNCIHKYKTLDNILRFSTAVKGLGDTMVKAEEIGTLILESYGHKYTIGPVFYVSKSQCQSLSLTKLREAGLELKFRDTAEKDPTQSFPLSALKSSFSMPGQSYNGILIASEVGTSNYCYQNAVQTD